MAEKPRPRVAEDTQLDAAQALLDRVFAGVEGIRDVRVSPPTEPGLPPGITVLGDERADYRDLKPRVDATLRELGIDFPGWMVSLLLLDVPARLGGVEETGKIASKVESPEGPPVAPAVAPTSVGKLVEMLRVLAEPMPVISPAHENLRRELTERFEEHADAPLTPGLVETLGDLALCMAQAARLREDANRFAIRARELGATWSDIGRAAGVTPQAATRRWNPEARKRHSDYERKRKQAQ